MAVATSTKTLSVNAAFLQDIKDNNPDLWLTFNQLRAICHDSSDGCRLHSLIDTARLLSHTLDALRTHIGLQFSLEESYGYIELPAHADVTNERQIESVLSQHCTLYLMISDLAEQAQELQYRGAEPEQLTQLIQSAQHFDTEFQRHECDENKLIELEIRLG